jgi:hypothetical protein
VGDYVRAVIVRKNPEKKRISLSMKPSRFKDNLDNDVQSRSDSTDNTVRTVHKNKLELLIHSEFFQKMNSRVKKVILMKRTLTIPMLLQNRLLRNINKKILLTLVFLSFSLSLFLSLSLSLSLYLMCIDIIRKTIMNNILINFMK